MKVDLRARSYLPLPSLLTKNSLETGNWNAIECHADDLILSLPPLCVALIAFKWKIYSRTDCFVFFSISSAHLYSCTFGNVDTILKVSTFYILAGCQFEMTVTGNIIFIFLNDSHSKEYYFYMCC